MSNDGAANNTSNSTALLSENKLNLIHMGVEIILFGAICFYFNKKNKSMRDEIVELKLQVEENHEKYVKHINDIYKILNYNHRVHPIIPIVTTGPLNNSNLGMTNRKNPAKVEVIEDDPKTKSNENVSSKIRPKKSETPPSDDEEENDIEQDEGESDIEKEIADDLKELAESNEESQVKESDNTGKTELEFISSADVGNGKRGRKKKTI